MADFLLDLRPGPCRSLDASAERLRFCSATQVYLFDEQLFGLIVTHTGDPLLRAPYRAEDGTLIAVAGHAAFDEDDWQRGACGASLGGVAAKIVYLRFREDGDPGLEATDGNSVVIAHDTVNSLIHLVADCAGAFPAFQCVTPEGTVYGSHPDVLAHAAGVEHALDEVSMAEFLLASSVTPPYTYYQRIQAVPHGTHIRIPLSGGRPGNAEQRTYFTFSYRGDSAFSQDQMADDLAGRFRRAVRRRTSTGRGTTAIALSGGMDSRLLAACIDDPESAFAFTCYERSNREFRAAKAVADALGLRFIPLQRSFEYYAENAEEGVRISGGMGTFANNHFLGVIERLRSEGMAHLLTGCYFDYLFKGLPLNRTLDRVTGRERLAPFRHEFYFSHRRAATPLAAMAKARWEARIPQELRAQETPEAVFEIETRRTFPLCYEADNQQRVVPQRVTGWCLPVADREILETYCRIPFTYKFNRSLMRRVLALVSGERLVDIPDANTGVPPSASATREALSLMSLRLARKLRVLRRASGHEGSWPDWRHGVAHSPTIQTLWSRPNKDASDFFQRVLGEGAASCDARACHGNEVFHLVSMLSLKLWLDQRQ